MIDTHAHLHACADAPLELVERARAAGVAVTYRRVAGMWHDFPVLAGLLAEADAALVELGAALHADCTRSPTSSGPP